MSTVGCANARISQIIGTCKGRGAGCWGQEGDSTLFSEHLKVMFAFQAAIRGPGKLVFQQALRFIGICMPILFGKLSLFPFSSVQAQLRGHCVTGSRERQCLGLLSES